jgi:hypothetical protein
MINGVEEVGLLVLITDVSIDEKRVCFRVDVFHGDLEPVEATRLRKLDLEFYD